ncbi:MAG: sodium:proton antiporter [Gammaproteobacteria bacterium RIFCSPLOWO2_02_47_7]|nr:MAG: sodium:proton antiporter [Gammaproteobacteria bacterium RIFCSPLOWO2_02_47_7]OGT73199.1 MAG: sodium:proton antiporter [Gammaproteobacteria bacterium RIFCSPLOWO2_12_47_11]
MNNEILISLTGIGVLGILCQWFAWWARLPAILFLLLAGIIIGPLTGLLHPDALFGEILFPLVSLSVAVILFEGSLTLRFDEIKGLGPVVRNLISIGALITWCITAVAAQYLLGFPAELAWLFGAVVVVTGPTVILPMLRTVRPNARIANILRWEGIVIDPLGALLAVLVFEFIISSQSGDAMEKVMLSFGSVVVSGTIIGFISAHALGVVLRHHLIPEYLRNVFSLILVFAVFTLSDVIEHESGLLAVTVMGITLANMKNTNIDDILDFKESLSLLLISGLFIILAARVEFYHFNQIGWPAVGVLAILMLVARPISVFISSIGSDLNFREKLLISWIGPRGIVAAAVASLFALRLEEAGYPDAVFLVPLTFLIIIGTVVIQSGTSEFIAKLLGVREPSPTGALIIGAGNVARAIGKAIQESGLKVILTDSNWENTSLARMEGLPTYYGNPISEHAERHLELTGIGRMLAMSGRANLDTLASLRFKSDFGEKGIYELKTTREKIISDKHKISSRHRGYQLFGEEITHGVLASWLRNGAEIRSTQLSDEFGFEAYMAKYDGKIIPLFAIDNKKRLQFFVIDGKMKPESGWMIISLIQPGELENKNQGVS